MRLHVAYTTFRASMVSCVDRIMGALTDLRAAASCSDNLAVYLEMVEIEAASTFGFQGHRWLADAAPKLARATA